MHAMIRNMLWLRVVIFVLIGTASFACGGDSETQEVSSGQTASPEAAPTSSAGAVSIAVTSRQLMEAYEADQASAAAIYEDNVVSVTGVVMEVAEKSLVGDPFIRLGKEDAYGQLGLNCYFEESNLASLSQVSKGDQTTLTGIVRKPSFDGVVKLDDCAVE